MEDFINSDGQKLISMVSEKSYTKYEPSPPFQIYVNLRFSCQRVGRHYGYFEQDFVIPPRFETIVGGPPKMDKSLRVSVQQFSRVKIEEILRDWRPVDEIWRQKLIDYVVKKVRQLVDIRSMPPHHNSLFLEFEFVGVHAHVYHGGHQYPVVKEKETSSSGIQPILWDKGACSICLEDFASTPAMYVMCRHVFHKDCYREWLKKSRTCPLCRAKIL